MKKRLLSLVLLGALLGGCSNQVPLAYVPTSQITAQALPAIGAITTVDQRGEADPTWIGAVRGGFGNPLKSLHTAKPVSDMVTGAFREALDKRGLLAPIGAGQADLMVTVTEFDSTKFVRNEGNVAFTLVLRDHATGRQIYQDGVKIALVQGSIVALDNGIFGSVSDLQATVQTAMNQAIDAALNKPGFLDALRHLPPPPA